jgi:uncharacterized protein with GYD domain
MLKEGKMLRSLVTASILAICLAGPAAAQQSTNGRYYLGYFKYSDNAINAMTENPTDRSVQARKLVEGFGGKMDRVFWFTSGRYDGFVIYELPDDATAEAIEMTLRASGNFLESDFIRIMNGEEFKTVLEKARQAKTGYTAPTETK